MQVTDGSGLQIHRSTLLHLRLWSLPLLSAPPVDLAAAPLFRRFRCESPECRRCLCCCFPSRRPRPSTPTRFPIRQGDPSTTAAVVIVFQPAEFLDFLRGLGVGAAVSRDGFGLAPVAPSLPLNRAHTSATSVGRSFGSFDKHAATVFSQVSGIRSVPTTSNCFPRLAMPHGITDSI